jgi:hypothetical protein
LSQKGGYIKALLELFPEIGLDEKMFPKVPGIDKGNKRE